MWEKSLIESKGGKKRKWWMFPLSLFLHALVIGIIVGMSYWMVEAVQAPPIPVTLYSAPPPPPPPPPAAAKRKAAPEEPKPKPVEKIEPKEVQPTIPEEIPIPEEDLTPTETGPVDESATDTGVDEGVSGGVEGGVVGGTEGGVPGGVLGGVQGGVIGGTPTTGDEVPMRITAEVKQPELIKKVEPPYPEVARRSKLEGVVVLEAVITKTGTVEEVKVLRALHPVLDQAALNAVKQWKYKPAVLNGRPVKVYFTVTVTFRLA
jgi:periplasmic protein TonB